MFAVAPFVAKQWRQKKRSGHGKERCIENPAINGSLQLPVAILGTHDLAWMP